MLARKLFVDFFTFFLAKKTLFFLILRIETYFQKVVPDFSATNYGLYFLKKRPSIDKTERSFSAIYAEIFVKFISQNGSTVL